MIQNKRIEDVVRYEVGRLAIPLGLYFDYDTLLSFGEQWLLENDGVISEKTASFKVKEYILHQVGKKKLLYDMIMQKKEIISQASIKLKRQGKEESFESLSKFLGIGIDKLYLWNYDKEIEKMVGLEKDQQTNVFKKENLTKFLEDAFLILKKNEKMVVDLFYYEGLTLDEIVFVLDSSRNEVIETHAIAMGKLREILGQYTELFCI